jgi:mono/diheme cytochrome c family protein|tara:strand:+ start:126 stop:824 length:699 start_codon:yes stop_codon:yes gene_type:complete
MNIRMNIVLTAVAAGLVATTGCVTDPDSPGLEYMPDMYRSPAIEAYVDYGQDPYQVGEEKARAQRMVQSARKPVAGTIRFNPSEIDFIMPYAYANTVEGYEAAGANLNSPLTQVGQEELEAGQEVYSRMCTQCHGEGGKGDGALSRNGHIVGIPSYSDKLKDLPEGKMYHTLTYGKGLMGSHASQLSQKDRWLVIEYIKVLQNGGDMPDFDDEGNMVKPVESDSEKAMAMNN